MSLNKEKFKYVGVNLILFAILYLSVTFNKEYIRPVYGSDPFLGILTGSFSNFMAAFIISLFPLAPIMAKKVEIKKSRKIFYSIAFIVFLLLTMEELKPYMGASKVYDNYDIIASGLGSLLAIIVFEIIFRRRRKAAGS